MQLIILRKKFFNIIECKTEEIVRFFELKELGDDMENIKEKINEILNMYERNHLCFYFNKTKEEVNKFIEDYLKQNKINNEEDLTYLIRLIIREVLGKYDSHTRFKRKERKLPLYFKYIDGSFYVVKCQEGYEEYLYSKLEKINGIDINTLISEMEKSICYSTKGHLISEIENMLSRTEMFIIPSLTEGNLTYELSKGEKKELNVDIDKEYKYDTLDKNYEYKIENDALILTYNSCKDFEKMENTVKEIKKVMIENNITNFILDLRGNTGGNSRVINPLINYLNNNDFNIVTLIDRYVFSSGRWAASDMKRLNSVFIGEDIGTSINCFGENKNETINIEDKEHTVQVATKYFGYINDNEIGSIPKEKLNKDTLELSFIHPDIYVEETIENLKDNRDVFLEAAFEYLKQKKLK